MHLSSPFSPSFALVHIEVRCFTIQPSTARPLTPIVSPSARQVAGWVLRVAPGHDIRSPSTRILQRFRPLVERCGATAAFD
jgi:hypothetical protein